MKEIIRYIAFPFLKSIYELSGIITRNKYYWGVSSHYRNQFIDNAKYLFLYATENEQSIKLYWFASDRSTYLKIKEMGGHVVMKNSLKGCVLALRCKFWFVTGSRGDINFYLSKGAILVNLWHGIPLKRIRLDVDFGCEFILNQNGKYIYRHLFKLDQTLPPDYVISTSEYVNRYSFSSAFNTPLERCLDLGYPRTDIFFIAADIRLKMLKAFGFDKELELIEKILQYNKTILYVPTFRDADSDFFEKINIDFGNLNERLKTGNSLVVVKLHPSVELPMTFREEKFSNIIFLDSSMDLYPVMPYTDALITDYSSIYFDYILLDKPIFFYCYDLEEYRKKSRGLYFDDYEKVTPGPLFVDSDELFLSILSTVGLADVYNQKRRNMKDLFFKYTDGLSSKRIVDFVKGIS